MGLRNVLAGTAQRRSTRMDSALNGYSIVHLTTESSLIEFHEKLGQLEVEMHLLETENEMK